MTRHTSIPTPTRALMLRRWETGPHAKQIRDWAQRMGQLSRTGAELLAVAVALEEGDLPLIEQYGFAQFRPTDSDHRLVSPVPQDHDELAREAESGVPSASTTAVGSGATAGRACAQAAGAEAGAPVRDVSLRGYGSVGEVIAEDSRGLALFFPQFSPPLYDLKLRLWYREGWLQPLRWWPSQFGVRLYYDLVPEALPLVCVAPPFHPNSPHLWQQVRNGVSFRSICYTFAPDGTVVRGRDYDDDAAEVLRQSLMWLLRYIVWLEFGFWPGEDVGHDPTTIERLTRPTDPCPAHSWRRYGECCRPRILDQLRRRDQLRFGVAPGARVA